MLSIFSCACWPSVYLLWKMSSQFLCPFLNLGVCFLDVGLYILDSNPVPDTSFADIFYSVDNLFIMLIISFSVHKGFLVWNSLICLLLLLCPLPEETSPPNITKTDVKELLSLFSSRILWFHILHLNWNLNMEKRLAVATEEEGWGEKIGSLELADANYFRWMDKQ